MSRVLVFVEGQTEETFVRDLLVPYFAPLGIYLTPILAQTSPGHKGGIVSYGKVKHQVTRLCRQDHGAYVTTLIDYYGLPTDFPDSDNQAQDAHQRVLQIEHRISMSPTLFLICYCMSSKRCSFLLPPSLPSGWMMASLLLSWRPFVLRLTRQSISITARKLHLPSGS